jgi:hypothetical protein
MQRIFLLAVVILTALSCTTKKKSFPIDFTLEEFYPRWLKNDEYRTAQTSGITFLTTNDTGEKIFLLADDIGKIHHLKITKDSEFTFSPVYFSSSVNKYFFDFPKLDFEGIVYDEHTNSVYISIEGNGEDHLKYFGIYKLIFINDNVLEDTITDIQKLSINPPGMISDVVVANVGYEGLAVDENNFYLGLEGIVNNGNFADSTFIFVVDRQSLIIKKKISTKEFNITTICALYSFENGRLLGVDRNSRKFFQLLINEKLEVVSHSFKNFTTVVPNYKEIEYVGSIESITIDDMNNIYCIDDPWYEYFIPDEETIEKLDEKTIENFNKYVPIIFKYSSFNLEEK